MDPRRLQGASASVDKGAGQPRESLSSIELEGGYLGGRQVTVGRHDHRALPPAARCSGVVQGCLRTQVIKDRCSAANGRNVA
jgi:hypothetical protein